jgi:hypothetical protein
VTATTASTPAGRTGAMRKGRQADSARRRQRVLTAIEQAAAAGEEISAAGIARAAAVDRTFLYRHRDLLEQIHASQAEPPDAGTGPAASSASLKADLLNAQHRSERMAARVRQLEHKLSALLGEHAWRESGLGAPDDIDELKQQNALLEQHVADLRLQLDERDQDLTAARSANRELMAQLNTTGRR